MEQVATASRRAFSEHIDLVHFISDMMPEHEATCVKLSARMTAVRGSSPAVRGTPDTFFGAIAAPNRYSITQLSFRC